MMLQYANYSIDRFVDVRPRNIDEMASYLAYCSGVHWDQFKRIYKRAAKRINVYTGARTLCLASEKPIPKVKDFDVLR